MRLLRLPRVQMALKAMLLFGLGIFLLTRITSGALNFYISDRFGWLTILAVLGLFVVGGSYYYLFGRRQGPRMESAATKFRDAEQTPAGDDGHGHPSHSDHQHGHVLGWVGFVIISLPILLGLLVPPRPLGVAALQTREISVGGVDSVLPAAVRSTLLKASSERTILDWVLAFHEGQWPAETDIADVTGFVYHDDNADGRQFTVTRFVVGCCAADAMAVGLPVSVDAARASGQPSVDELEEGQWVRVVGRFAAAAGNALPVLVAEQLDSVPEPSQPYLYP